MKRKRKPEKVYNIYDEDLNYYQFRVSLTKLPLNSINLFNVHLFKRILNSFIIIIS